MNCLSKDGGKPRPLSLAKSWSLTPLLHPPLLPSPPFLSPLPLPPHTHTPKLTIFFSSLLFCSPFFSVFFFSLLSSPPLSLLSLPPLPHPSLNFRAIFPSSAPSFTLFSLWGSSHGMVATGRGHGPPEVHVWASLGSFCASSGERKKINGKKKKEEKKGQTKKKENTKTSSTSTLGGGGGGPTFFGRGGEGSNRMVSITDSRKGSREGRTVDSGSCWNCAKGRAVD